MEKGIVKANEFNKVDAFDKMMSLAEELGGQVPQVVNASTESSSAFIESQKSEIKLIDEQLKSAKSPEEKQFLWNRRDAACDAIDRKDVQNKSYGLKVVGILGGCVVTLAGCTFWLIRKVA